MSLAMKHVDSMNNELFTKSYHLLKNSFVPDELRDFTAELFNNHSFSMYAVLQDNRFIGATTFWTFDEFILVEYIVTDPSQRGQNVGTQVLQWLKITSEGKLIIGEIDPPVTEIAVRRKNYFKRHGFHANDFDYIQPAYALNKAPVPMIIISHPQALDRATYEGIKNQIYRVVYNVKERLDSR
jgi:GNAT superfamily N-acetyltransferase